MIRLGRVLRVALPVFLLAAAGVPGNVSPAEASTFVGASGQAGGDGIGADSGCFINTTNPNNYNYDVSSAVSSNTRNAITAVAAYIDSSPLDAVATSSYVDHRIYENTYSGSFCGESWANLYGYTFCDYLYQQSQRCGRHTTRFDANDMAGFTSTQRKSAVCHEFGHVFGLVDNNVAPGCMIDPSPLTSTSYSTHDVPHLGEVTRRAFPGDRLVSTNDHLTSANNIYNAYMQRSDGNFVIYGSSGAIYSANTSGAGNFAAMQTDGNFVIYSSAGVARCSTRTGGYPNAFAQLGTDGNFVVYSSSGTVLRATSAGGFCL